MMFDRDIISLLKPDGTVIENIKADVQPNIIFIKDGKLPLEENDKLYRQLPNGLVEIYLVLDRGYYSGFGGHYQAKVKKEGSINEEKYKSIVNIYNANGANSKINVNSTDNSKNYYNDSELLFKELRLVLEQIANNETREKSLSVLNELEKSKHTPSFISHYKNFISLLADQITVITPFIPALTQLF